MHFKPYCSLSKEKRRQELVRITKENQKILFRLNQCRPNYNVKTWEEDWRRTLRLRNSIARYPRTTAHQQKVLFYQHPLRYTLET